MHRRYPALAVPGEASVHGPYLASRSSLPQAYAYARGRFHRRCLASRPE